MSKRKVFLWFPTMTLTSWLYSLDVNLCWNSHLNDFKPNYKPQKFRGSERSFFIIYVRKTCFLFLNAEVVINKQILHDGRGVTGGVVPDRLNLCHHTFVSPDLKCNFLSSWHRFESTVNHTTSLSLNDTRFHYNISRVKAGFSEADRKKKKPKDAKLDFSKV